MKREQKSIGEIVCERMSRVCVSLICFWLQAHDVCHSNGQDLAQAMCPHELARFEYLMFIRLCPILCIFDFFVYLSLSLEDHFVMYTMRVDRNLALD